MFFFHFFLYLISGFGDLDSLYLTCGFGDLDFVIKICCSLHVLVLDFDFKCIWFLWIGNLNGYGGFDLRFIWICCLCCTVVILFSQENKFFLIDWAIVRGWRLGPEVAWLGRAGLGPSKKPFNKRTGSGSRVLAHGSGTGMKKLCPNLTRCHFYWSCDIT